MAGQVSSFLHGASCILRIGDVRIAYAQSLNVQARMDNTAIVGIGSAGPLALEPVMHGCTYSMQITRYTTTIVKGDSVGGVPDRTAQAHSLPENLQGVKLEAGRDGNSVIDQASFNPQLLLLSTTFDIDVYERLQSATGGQGAEGALLYRLVDCRLSNYSFSFQPGQLLIENVSGVARFLEDSAAIANPRIVLD